MGLFDKKPVCPVCGKKIKGDLVVKIKDNVPLCTACSTMVNMDADLLPLQDEVAIREHIKYREENQAKYDAFTDQPNWDEKIGAFRIRVDEAAKIWYCTQNKKDKNPPIFTYNELVDVRYLEDGEVPVEEEKKGGIAGLFGGGKEERYIRSMKLRLILDNPYTRLIDIEMLDLNDETKVGSMGYKSKRHALEKGLHYFQGMLAFTGRNA